MLKSNYNHFATTNDIWSTIHNVTSGRTELHSNPVALKLNLKLVPKVSGENGVKENNMMVLLEKIFNVEFLTRLPSRN